MNCRILNSGFSIAGFSVEGHELTRGGRERAIVRFVGIIPYLYRMITKAFREWSAAPARVTVLSAAMFLSVALAVVAGLPAQAKTECEGETAAVAAQNQSLQGNQPQEQVADKRAQALREQARQEYLQPLRPGKMFPRKSGTDEQKDGITGRKSIRGKERPFWNVYSHRFLYAPAFPFEGIKGARSYRFTVVCEDGTTLSFLAKSPQADLSPVWDRIPVGEVSVSVEGLRGRMRKQDRTAAGAKAAAADTRDDVIGAAHIEGPVGVSASGTVRSFTRDFPFEGPYDTLGRPVAAALGDATTTGVATTTGAGGRTYAETILAGLHYIHAMPQIRRWLTDTLPDMSYSYFTYPCKIMGATIRAECLLARLDPDCRDEALAIARAVADFLIRESRPAGEPLACFPPTYYSGPGGVAHASGFQENQGKTMMMEAIRAGEALLDLYAATGEKKYFDHAVGIANTYCAHQAADGSLPIKVDIATGEPVNEVRAMLGTFLSYLLRLQRDFGQEQFHAAEKKADRWMKRVPMRTFDLTAQFEDVTVQDLHPYENLTNVTACNYATYLMAKDRPSRREIQDARDLIALSEDQFVHWQPYKDTYATPSVFEQHKYQESINSSTSDVAGALLGYWRHTGDPLALEKARALVDVLVNTQETGSGFLPTSLKNTRAYGYFWMNCAFHSIEALMLMEAAD